MASRFCLRFGSRLWGTLSQLSVHRSSPFIAVIESPLLIASHSTHLPVTPFEYPFSTAGLRYLSTLRRQPDRKRTVDIGARARQLQNRRLWTYALTFSCVAGFIVIVLNNFQDQLVFYVTPTDAMEKYSANPSKNKFRLGGLVLEGSVTEPDSSPEMEFVVTDLITDILVRYQGSLPDLFREGHSVVVEGFVRPFTDEARKKVASAGTLVSAKAWSGDCYFAATEVLAKHDEKYMPTEVAAAIERNKAKIEASEQESVRVS
ncbi:hypothetical protein NE237_010753 [Protea cynaroides]|uniref:Uncharacterized protein n=1 Tax=Protea cynaroides TaxID=273540 RepID=A0A9Q0KZX7_9MAGN|nr:hypothetical protein NE237_010753 [Protea cynaroides]